MLFQQNWPLSVYQILLWTGIITVGYDSVSFGFQRIWEQRQSPCLSSQACTETGFLLPTHLSPMGKTQVVFRYLSFLSLLNILPDLSYFDLFLDQGHSWCIGVITGAHRGLHRFEVHKIPRGAPLGPQQLGCKTIVSWLLWPPFVLK